MTTPTPAELDYSTTCQGHAGTDPVDFRGIAEKCVYAIHGSLMLGREGVPEAIRYLKAWTDAARRAPNPDRARFEALRSEAEKALRCLHVAVPEEVARDVAAKVQALVHALEADLSEARDLYRETEIRRCEALTQLSEAERVANENAEAGFRAVARMQEAEAGWKLAAADLARETERANRAEECSELVAGAAASESLRADAATERAERAAALRSALASTPEAPAAPSAEEATAPQFIPGGAFCGCGRVEFVCPGVPVARTHGPDGVTLHRPGGCRLATDAELSNLPAPAATPDPTTSTKEG